LRLTADVPDVSAMLLDFRRLAFLPVAANDVVTRATYTDSSRPCTRQHPRVDRYSHGLIVGIIIIIIITTTMTNMNIIRNAFRRPSSHLSHRVHLLLDVVLQPREGDLLLGPTEDHAGQLRRARQHQRL
jgi:hypothetical protein